MRKYNIQNYLRYKEDLKKSMPDYKDYDEYTRDELIIKFMPLVENLARKFSMSQQASGVLSINDVIQIGNEALVKAVDKLDQDMLDQSKDIEKTLKSFLSKRIKGAIRRRIDMFRGGIRIPEHKINEIRSNPDNEKMVSIFFNSVFPSYDAFNVDSTSDNAIFQIPDESKEYNIHIMNEYLIGLLRRHLNEKEQSVLILSYGLNCDKHSAKEIAHILNIEGSSSYVRISELKKQAVLKLIDNVDHSQVIDFL